MEGLISHSYNVNRGNALDVNNAMVVGDMITFQHNYWADKMDVQIVGAGFIVILAWMGLTFDMVIPDWLPILLSAKSGSIQSLFARVKHGYVKGVGAMFWAFIAGMTGGVIIGHSVGVMMGLEGSIAVILPVYIFALMGGRLVLYIATGVSVEDIGNTIVGMFTKNKN